MTALPARGSPAAARSWIVGADDFAIDAGAVDGIVALIERGRLTATSALVDSALWRGAARALPADIRAGADRAPRRADIGLHLNLTQAFAGTRQPVWSLRELIVRCALGAIARAPLRAAIERQLDAFENEMGRGPDYVDGHQHVHQFAGVREELVAALVRRYPGALPWIRSTRRPPGVTGAKAHFIAALGDRPLRALAQCAGIGMSAYLVGIYDFDADRDSYRKRLQRWLECGPAGSFLMCHPASHASSGDPIAPARTMEYSVLAGDEFAQALAAAGIASATGTRLLGKVLPATA